MTEQPRARGIRALFETPEGERGEAQISQWWAERRGPYNWMVLPTAFASVVGNALVYEAYGTYGAEEWSDDGPFGLLGSCCFFPLAINAAFTLGPFTERIVRRFYRRDTHRLASTLFRLGVAFSLGLILLPLMVSLGAAAQNGFRSLILLIKS